MATFMKLGTVYVNLDNVTKIWPADGGYVIEFIGGQFVCVPVIAEADLIEWLEAASIKGDK